jgi:putative transposase
MKDNPKGVTTAMQLNFSGETLRSTANSVILHSITHQTVYNWIGKDSGLITKYLEQIIPNVSDAWRTDELFVKVKGKTK